MTIAEVLLEFFNLLGYTENKGGQYDMKKIAFLLVILVVALNGCQAQDQLPELIASEGDFYLPLTTEQAAVMGYERAVQWKRNAVLWYMNPSAGLSDNWAESDTSYEWGMLFADPFSKKLYHVDIRGNQVVYEGTEPYVYMQSKYNELYPIVQPKVTMKQAFKVANSYGAPAQKLQAIYYIIDNSNPGLQGIPVWEIVYQDWQYEIDALNADLLFAKNKVTKKTFSRQEFLDQQARQSTLEEEKLIRSFFSLISENNVGQAVFLLSNDLAGTDVEKNNWAAKLKNIDSIEILKFQELNQDYWKQDKHYYKINLLVTYFENTQENPDWPVGQIAKIITLTKIDDNWLISQIEQAQNN